MANDINTLAQNAVYLDNSTFTAQPGYIWQGVSQTVSEQTWGAVYLANKGVLNGGGTTDDPVIFTDNHSSQYGNAIAVMYGTAKLDLDYVVFAGNTASASQGGAVYSRGNVNLNGATFSNNSATSGGAFFGSASSAVFENSLFSGNTATHGGALYNDGAVITLTNSTFRNNRASNLGGVIRNNNTLYMDGGGV